MHKTIMIREILNAQGLAPRLADVSIIDRDMYPWIVGRMCDIAAKAYQITPYACVVFSSMLVHNA